VAIARDGDPAYRDPGQRHFAHRNRGSQHRPQRGLAVGATVALLGLFASPISGASMNPARTLGPDIVAVDFTGWLVSSWATSSVLASR